MNIILVSDWQGINYHRLVIPIGKIAMKGLAPVHIIDDVLDLFSIDLSKVDRFIFSRHLQLTPEGYQSISKLLQDNNVKVIIDVDDYWVLPTDNPAYEAYEQNHDPKQSIRRSIENAIKIADHLWTTSKLIYKYAKKLNPKLTHTVIPNAIDPGEGSWSMNKNFGSGVRFGYTGAKGHTKDIKKMGVDWSKHYTFTTNLEGYDKLLHADDVSSPLSLHNYGMLYENFNVSLAPLQSGTFHKCKSNLKAIEAGFTGCALIASNTTPYKELIVHGENGLLCNSFPEWNEAVNSMTKKEAKRLADNLYETVREEYHIDNVIKLRVNELQ